MRGAAMSFRAGLSGLVFLLLAAAGVMEENTRGVIYPSPQICAVKGSTVDIPCTFTYPTTINQEHSFWFTKSDSNGPLDLKSDSDYKDRVEYFFSAYGCTLRITDLRESDSAEFKFTFTSNQRETPVTTSPGVTLSVTDGPLFCSVSKSPTGEIRENNEVTLTCSCDGYPPPEYTWNKENHPGRVSSESQHVFRSIQSSDSGHYYCWAKNDLGQWTSASIDIDVKYAPKSPTVSVRPSAEVLEGTTVTLTCSSDANPAPTYTWYKRTGDQRGPPVSTNQQLYFWSIKASDSGEYYCTAVNTLGAKQSETTKVDVQYAPKSPTVSVSPSAEVLEGTSVTLTCSSDANPAPEYTWYKRTGGQRSWTPSKNKHPYFRSIKASDSGEYYCTAGNKHGEKQSKDKKVDVQYAPRQTSASVSPPGDVVEGSSVTLTCQSDANPAPAFTWYKKRGNQISEHINEGHQLHLSPIKLSDSAAYSCEATNKRGKESSPWILIDVKYHPKPPNVSVSPSSEVKEGTAVNLSCIVDAKPPVNYTWYKKNDDKPKSFDQIFTIPNTTPEHSGTYVCVTQSERGRQNSTILLTVVSGSRKSTVIYATVPAVFITVILVFVLVWIVKKKTSKQSSQPEDRPDNSEQIQQSEQQDDLQYGTVHFSKNQPDPVYSNVTPNKPKRHKQMNEEDVVEYSAMNFNKARAVDSSHGEDSAEDPALLYSTVNEANKKCGRQNL